MIDDEHHEAHGAMTYRGLVEQRTNTRNFHKEQKEALEYAMRILTRISKCHDAEASIVMAESALDHIKEMIG